MKKRFVLFAILMIASLMLGACKPKAKPEAPAVEAPVVEEPAVEKPAAEEPAKEEPAKEEPVVAPPSTPDATLRIWADDTRSAILAPLADAFLAEYNVKVIIEEVANIRDQFIIAAPAGEGPDITIVPHDQAGQLVASGLLAPIDLGSKAGDFVDFTIDAFTFDGQLYGMPYASENLAFFYNKDLVDAAPETWDELVVKGMELQDAGKVDWGFVLSGTTYDAFPLMTSQGAYVFGRDSAGNWLPNDIGIGGEGMIKAGKLMQEWIELEFMSPNTDWDTAHALFETGEVPWLMAGPWALDRIRAAGVPYAISDFPDGGLPFLGVQGFIVNALSENQLLAQAFLTEFVATKDVMYQLYEAGNRPPAYIPALELVDDEDMNAFGSAGTGAMPMPALAEMGSVWGAWNDAITLIIQGEMSPEDALTNAQHQIEELIGGALAGMVNVPGSWQAAAGCPGDWQPDCEATALKEVDGLYVGTFNLPAGSYEVKVALDGSWGVNFGVDGIADGDNYQFELAADGEVTFIYDPDTHLLEIKLP
ncbi:MAG TPA: extracellular solute-binding protein [Brevefilum fermentans]|jgi:maltose/maltodextrin transport system substrate-binding protein/arabinogalactan oligomer/maltooligosaccharide transport system substrate-binding protein|uniref:Putative ABC transporter substrate binding protein n=1 Tax=Candidatus Brevifilum fermentans TaxID=1986204 RepID=A0A1Y6K4M8_9CHLR|nr:extracellular solute-binding protein [Brevefilum fermentans]MDI9566784.1 extracellular solute-binding protein [Chloroflexota bacterium]SMX54506.1 putative ABC transporter substrate binding protein [Brevefilum fermentans]HQA29418.1 extracellular solute-binding protein [Brevefilum fermentans]